MEITRVVGNGTDARTRFPFGYEWTRVAVVDGNRRPVNNLIRW